MNIVYFASPIDNDTKATNERPKIKQELVRGGHVVFDPSAGWTVSDKAATHPNLQAANMAVLKYSDALFVYLTPVFSVGTVLEIVEAQKRGISTVVYAPRIKPSWALAYLRVEPFTDLAEAIDELESVVRHA